MVWQIRVCRVAEQGQQQKRRPFKKLKLIKFEFSIHGRVQTVDAKMATAVTDVM